MACDEMVLKCGSAARATGCMIDYIGAEEGSNYFCQPATNLWGFEDRKERRMFPGNQQTMANYFVKCSDLVGHGCLGWQASANGRLECLINERTEVAWKSNTDRDATRWQQLHQNSTTVLGIWMAGSNFQLRNLIWLGGWRQRWWRIETVLALLGCG